LPITDGNRSYIEWSSRFDIDPEHEAQLVDLMNRNFFAELRALAEKMARLNCGRYLVFVGRARHSVRAVVCRPTRRARAGQDPHYSCDSR